LISRATKLIPFFAHGVQDGDRPSVRPDQEKLLSVADLALREKRDLPLGSDGYPFGEAIGGRQQDEGAIVIRPLSLFNAKDDAAGLWVAIRFGTTDRRWAPVE
jgi:hypothetical protein